MKAKSIILPVHPVAAKDIFEDRAKSYFRPYGAAVLCRPIPEEEITKSGFYIPDSAKNERPGRSEVLVCTWTADISTGDILIHGKYAGTEVSWHGEKLLHLPLADILGVE